MFQFMKLFRPLASSRPCPRKSLRSSRFLLEQLEDRRLLSGNVQIQLYGSYTLNSYAGVGFQENEVATMQVQVNGQPDINKGDFQAQIQWGDGKSSTGDLVYLGTNGGWADYLIKGSHVYQNTGTDIPITLTVTGPGGTSASFLPQRHRLCRRRGHAQRHSRYAAVSERQPHGACQRPDPGIWFVHPDLLCRRRLPGERGRDHASQVNGQPDTTLSDFHAQINWGDSASWNSGDLVYQGTNGGWADYLIKGSHVYQKPGTDIPIVVYVTGPDGTSATVP